VFSDPPAEADLERLSLERGEIRALERCRPRDCGLKLSAETIDRLHTEVDWSSRTAGDEANRFFRRELLSAMTAYSEGGNKAAPVYADKGEPLDVAEGFERLMADDDYLGKLDPVLREYLTAYPLGRSRDIEDAFSWTVEDLGVKSVVSLNHIAVKPRGASGSALIGVKRVYANHYFQAGLRVIVLTPGADDSLEADSYVTVITRLRFDGDLGGIKRTAIERRLERNAEAVLAAVRDQLEAWYLQQ
jgi:hypothetical protein